MLIVEHRKNTIGELRAVPLHHGVEIDIRSDGENLILHHDPFCKGTNFEEWLEYFNHRFIILNVKEEGIEGRIQELLDKRNIKDYFYLDLSFPFLIKIMKKGQKNIAVRFSEYESIETCLTLAGKVDWVWVDCITKFPLTEDNYMRLSEHFRICLVSPELLGRPREEIQEIKKKISGRRIDMICTKLPDAWFEDE